MPGHGVVDIEHTQDLYRALDAELGVTRDVPHDAASLLEGVGVLRALIERIVHVGVEEDVSYDTRLTTRIAA
ncbi:MAG: hypothetical protein DMD81_24760 [Candidatus Rokuibacteriota bacterium]|nr:MAG: hypothetical protein DMD81_24760 [Candidatus Rokubacteria bacterium]